ncbi:metalloprotease, partial [Coemansia sp. RSA 2424]
MDRELCAIDSEFKGLLNKDFWHSSQLARKLGNPEHPFSKFLVGNIESLKQSAKDNGLDLHEELLKFYNKYYSSDIMKLVVCGNHSLDRLVEWAASKFSDIKSNGDNVQRIFDHPLSAENLGKAVYVETIDDKHTINITFPVPYTKAMYRHDPFAYIAHLIGHEGQGSIKAYLRKQGWVANLSASANTDENKGFAEFSIYINSAPEGLEHYVDVLHAVFAYVQMLVASGPQEWIYLEIATLRRIMFDSRKKPTALACVLNYLHLIHNEYVAPEHVLSKDSMYETFNYDDILHCLSFINPNNFRVFLGAAKHKSVDCSEIEPYFGTRYHVDSISSDLLIGLASDATHIKSLCLPERNVFMPNDFTVKSANMLGAAAVLRPTLLKLNDNFELWFKQDDQFATLKGSIMLSIKLPTANTSPMKNVMSIMYCNLLDSNLRSGLCNARYAGLSFQVRFTNSAIEINVAGFTSKLPDLLMAILERVKFVMIDETQFVRYSADYHQAI